MLNQTLMIKNSPTKKSQNGLVLFIALIALVAMSLAAAALIRSVDSGVLVAGNLAFKQSAIMSAETGIARAYRFINESGDAALEASNGGYFANLDGLLFETPA
jgi:Tfp pilus assembly protein PilX